MLLAAKLSVLAHILWAWLRVKSVNSIISNQYWSFRLSETWIMLKQQYYVWFFSIIFMLKNKSTLVVWENAATIFLMWSSRNVLLTMKLHQNFHRRVGERITEFFVLTLPINWQQTSFLSRIITRWMLIALKSPLRTVPYKLCLEYTFFGTKSPGKY